MPNFKPQIKDSEINTEGKVNIKIRVSHERKTRYIKTNHYVFPDQFNKREGRVKSNHPNYKFINLDLQKKVIELEEKVLFISNKIKSIDISRLMALLRTKDTSQIDFLYAMNEKINTFKEHNKKTTAETYELTSKKLDSFMRYEILPFSEVNYKFLTQFETFLKKQDLSTNTISIHLRNIRAVFNYAIDMGYTGLEHYPFRRFKIKKEKTAKRNLSIEQIKSIRNVQYLTEHETFSRDFFMLSFYLIGINLTDMYNIKELKNDRLVYRRAKTGRIYDVKVYPEAMELIEKYKGKKNLLMYADRFKLVHSLKSFVNEHLKFVAAKAEVSEELSTYYARHTWATVANNIGISKDVISHALGHGNNTVTDIYIDFDLHRVDEANRRVIDAIID